MSPSRTRFDAAAFRAHLARGEHLLATGAFDEARDAFEQAHLLGQPWTVPHTRSHLAFLALGWARRDGGEILGQLLRMAWSALLTWWWVPASNLGSTRVPAWRSGATRLAAPAERAE